MRINTYDENGVPASTNLGRFGFTGGVFLPEIGMYEFRNRVYNPSIGRFMQPDPIGTAGGPNLYAYAGGDPINSIDPSGLASFTTAPGLTCGVICTGSLTSPGVAYSYLTARYSWSAPFQTSSNPVGTGATNVSAFGPGFDNSQGIGALHQLVADAPVFHFPARPGGASNQPSGFAGVAAAGQGCPASSGWGRAGDTLGKLNAAGATGLGLVAGAAGYLAGKFAGTNPAVGVGNNAIQFTGSPLNVGGRAFTLGNFQIYGPTGPGAFERSYSGNVVNIGRHEEGHTYQSQWLGLGGHLLAHVGLGVGKASNPLELAADRYAQGQSCSGF
jgi:RHS repeat-associated protein